MNCCCGDYTGFTDRPFCTTPFLWLDRTGISLNKCGFQLTSGGLFYTNKNTPCGGSASYGGLTSGTKWWKKFTETYNGCPPHYSGTVTAYNSLIANPATNGATCYFTGYVCSGSIDHDTDPYLFHDCVHLFPGHEGVPNSSDNDADYTLSDEDTTADLIARCSTYFPAWPDTYVTSVAGGLAAVDNTYAYRNLTTDESNYSIIRFRYKVHHAPTASCYLKCWIVKRWRAEGADPSSDTITPVTTYVWSASGDPCFTNPTLGFNHSTNLITSGLLGTENEPATDGKVWIEISKWSCLEDYEPDDPNLDGTRPSPDLNPNGWPKGKP